VRPRLPFLKRRRREQARDTVLEVLAVDGEDTGQQFTLDGPMVTIGRGRTRKGRSGEIRLADPTVSSRQAVIHLDPECAVLEHAPEATNPTLVNGREITRKAIVPGDRIQVGSVVLEVRERKGIALSRLTEDTTETRRIYPDRRADRTVAVPGPSAAEMTQVRASGPTRGRLRLLRGVPELEGRTFPLDGETTTIGRSPSSDVVIPEMGVSRDHAEFSWEGGALLLRHRSPTNATYVNGVRVEETQWLRGGEEIQLADQVVLSVELGAGEQPASPATRADEQPGLRTIVEEHVRRDQEIERKYGVVGSFLDIDAVDSYGLKARASRREYIIISFERFRAFAMGIIDEFDGQFLNSNGDELMSFFESPIQAVRAASALLERLDEFNEKENLLGGPFRVRQGIHTGHCLVDRDRGVAYSDVLDVAGHLQKEADTNGLLISEHTLKQLPEGIPFEPADPLPKQGIPTYRLVGPVD
jgi:pSer/pThr/pTyr-binding forkhead associated (FHA) protein